MTNSNLTVGGLNFQIEMSAWSGNVKPFAARVYQVNGDERVFIGQTGFCKGEGRAREAGEKLAAQAAKKVSDTLAGAAAGAEIPAELQGGLPRAEAPAAPAPLTMTPEAEVLSRAGQHGGVGTVWREVDATRRSLEACVDMGVAACKELTEQRDAVRAALEQARFFVRAHAPLDSPVVKQIEAALERVRGPRA